MTALGLGHSPFVLFRAEKIKGEISVSASPCRASPEDTLEGRARRGCASLAPRAPPSAHPGDCRLFLKDQRVITARERCCQCLQVVRTDALCSQPPCDQHDRTRRGVEGPRGWGRGPGSSPGAGHRHYIERTFLERWLQSRHVLEKHWFVPYGYENHSTALSCDLIDIQIATTDNSAVVVANFFNKKHFFKMLIHLILLYVQSHVFQNHSAG